MEIYYFLNLWVESTYQGDKNILFKHTPRYTDLKTTESDPPPKSSLGHSQQCLKIFKCPEFCHQ